jgi:hypothetical protein
MSELEYNHISGKVELRLAGGTRVSFGRGNIGLLLPLLNKIHSKEDYIPRRPLTPEEVKKLCEGVPITKSLYNPIQGKRVPRTISLEDLGLAIKEEEKKDE